MTQLTGHGAMLQIEDYLDAVGQKYRVQRIVRGLLLFLGCGAVVSVAAALVAHGLGAGVATRIIAGAWMLWLAGSFAFWFIRPVFLRPRPLAVARLIESRVDGLHNGFTNGILLSRADDLRQSPFLPQIFDEILATAQNRPLGDAVKIGDLRNLTIVMFGLAALAGVTAMIFRPQVFHGWRQMLAPSEFVPQVGAMQIVDVQPGDVTLVAGAPLEISVVANGPLQPSAKLIFAPGPPPAVLTPSPQDDGSLRYGYRLDRVDESLKYRVEVASTQSQWYSVTVVKQVKLRQLELKITPPGYTHQPQSGLTLKPEDIDKTPILVPQGSQIDLSATVDAPIQTSMLQIGDSTQAPMEASEQGHRFSASFSVVADATIYVELMEGQQIIAKLPDNGVTIHVKPDAPPSISMKWPAQDTTTAPTRDLTIAANIQDDYGLSAARLLMGVGDDPLTLASEEPKSHLDGSVVQYDLKLPLTLKPELAKHGQIIHVQIEAVDNRELSEQMREAGLSAKDDGRGQTTRGPILEIRLEDPAQIQAERQEKYDKLRALLLQMLKTQQDLQVQAVAYKPGDRPGMNRINSGQGDLRALMQETAQKFEFDATSQFVQKTLTVLGYGPAKDAIDLSGAIAAEPVAKEQARLNILLRAKQQHIISTLESLLAMLKMSAEPTTQPSGKGDQLVSKAEAYKKLEEALKKFMNEERRILEQTATLAKKPVDNFDDADKKLMADLQMAQEKLDAFMQETLSDFSKNAEQDLSNSSLLKELFEIQSETTMAKDALKQQAAEIAVPLEENGLELAKEQVSNIEKWLSNQADRQQWTQEDPAAHTDTPMAELPAELEDMVGQLLEQQEDLFQQMEDANANWQDSMDKGVGWDAADGPIADMSAKGVTGNQLPNDNEMQGRSGEGRSGRSQGEFVDETAQGKGGRNTPTRLDPTPFEKGQVKDTSKDPTGGATGGGKVSGQGGQGLQGPVPPQMTKEMQRLAQKQAELRNQAERLSLKYQLSRYDNFKMLQSIALMRRVEADLNANRYQNAMRRSDVLVDAMETSKLLLGGQISVQRDTTPTASTKLQKQISDAMKGTLPPAWSEALKQYYQKLADQ